MDDLPRITRSGLLEYIEQTVAPEGKKPASVADRRNTEGQRFQRPGCACVHDNRNQADPQEDEIDRPRPTTIHLNKRVRQKARYDEANRHRDVCGHYVRNIGWLVCRKDHWNGGKDEQTEQYDVIRRGTDRPEKQKSKESPDHTVTPRWSGYRISISDVVFNRLSLRIRTVEEGVLANSRSIHLHH